jgi:preprotein translocase subunit SecD
MKTVACFAVVLLPGLQLAFGQDNAKLPTGVYAVERDSRVKNDLLPLKAGEVMLVNHYRYVKNDARAAPRYLVVRSTLAMHLDLAAAPRADKSGEVVTRISLKLRPEAARSLEKLTQDRQGGSLAIVVAGDVVTMHKIRSIIRGGDVQITNCAPGAAAHLLKHLEAVYTSSR